MLFRKIIGEYYALCNVLKQHLLTSYTGTYTGVMEAPKTDQLVYLENAVQNNFYLKQTHGYTILRLGESIRHNMEIQHHA